MASEDDLTSWVNDLAEPQMREVLHYLLLLNPEVVKNAMAYVQRHGQTDDKNANVLDRNRNSDSIPSMEFQAQSSRRASPDDNDSDDFCPNPGSRKSRPARDDDDDDKPPSLSSHLTPGKPKQPPPSSSLLSTSSSHANNSNNNSHHSTASTSTTSSKKTLLVLCSGKPSTKAQATNQNRAMTILKARAIVPVIVLGETDVDKRNQLCGISKMRHYPQFFLQENNTMSGNEKDDDDARTTFLGDFDEFESLNDVGKLGSLLMAENTNSVPVQNNNRNNEYDDEPQQQQQAMPNRNPPANDEKKEEDDDLKNTSTTSIVPDYLLNLNQPKSDHMDNKSLDGDDLFDELDSYPPSKHPLLDAAKKAKEAADNNNNNNNNSMPTLMVTTKIPHELVLQSSVPDFLLHMNQPNKSHNNYDDDNKSLDDDDLFDELDTGPPSPHPLLDAAKKAKAAQEEEEEARQQQLDVAKAAQVEEEARQQQQQQQMLAKATQEEEEARQQQQQQLDAVKAAQEEEEARQQQQQQLDAAKAAQEEEEARQQQQQQLDVAKAAQEEEEAQQQQQQQILAKVVQEEEEARQQQLDVAKAAQEEEEAQQQQQQKQQQLDVSQVAQVEKARQQPQQQLEAVKAAQAKARQQQQQQQMSYAAKAAQVEKARQQLQEQQQLVDAAQAALDDEEAQQQQQQQMMDASQAAHDVEEAQQQQQQQLDAAKAAREEAQQQPPPKVVHNKSSTDSSDSDSSSSSKDTGPSSQQNDYNKTKKFHEVVTLKPVIQRRPSSDFDENMTQIAALNSVKLKSALERTSSSSSSKAESSEPSAPAWISNANASSTESKSDGPALTNAQGTPTLMGNAQQPSFPEEPKGEDGQEEIKPVEEVAVVENPDKIASPERTNSFDNVPGNGACYLVYIPVLGELNIHYSEIPIVGAVGLWTSPDIIAFKNAQGLGQSELIGNCASGVTQEQKNYYSGWCQFIKAAKSMDATVTVLDVGLPVDFYLYQGGMSTMAGGSFETEHVDAVACLPKNHEFYDNAPLDGKKWKKKAKKAGAVAEFSSLSEISAAPGATAVTPIKMSMSEISDVASPEPDTPPATPAPATTPAFKYVPVPVPTADERATEIETRSYATPALAPIPSGGACYLVYDPGSSGRLELHYSHTPVENAIGMWTPGEGKKLSAFKFNQNLGKSVLIGSCASGGQGRKNYCSGWCQFIRSATLLSGEVILWDPMAKGLMVDVWVYTSDNRSAYQSVKLTHGVPTKVDKLLAVACIPKNTLFYANMTVDLNKWLADANAKGAASKL
jgi:hypothetical protein